MESILKCVGLLFIYILFCWVGLRMVRRKITGQQEKNSNELVLMVFGVAGLLYSLILAFVVTSVWEDYEEISSTVAAEANCLNDMYNYSSVLPDSIGAPIKNDIRNYTDAIVNYEWGAMEHEDHAVGSDPKYVALRTHILNYGKSSAANNSYFQNEFNILLSVSDLRRKRLDENTSHLPPLVWSILFGLSFITLLTSFYYRSENFKLQLFLTCQMGMMFALMMYLCFALDHPFQKPAQPSKEPYQVLLDSRFKLNE